MPAQLDKTSLHYLGEEYQYKLVKEFMEDKSCFKDLAPIIDQNMFTGQYLRMYVGTMLEYLRKHGDIPSYSSMAIELRQKAHTKADIEICDGVVNKIKNTPSEGSEQTRELATKFFKQQNIIKAANEMLRLAGTGELDNYEKCEQLLRDALNTGNHEDYEESRLFDGIDETLSEEFRTIIPTGIGKVDETLNGGIGKGELGVIVGPSSFGKVQPYDAKIVTPNGIVEMRDIKVGSKIIGSDGKSHNVTAVFPHKDWDFYKVKFSDGSSTECGKEHLWTVTDKKGVTSTKCLGEIISLGLKNFTIATTKPVEFNEAVTEMEPCVLIKLIVRGVISPIIPDNYIFNSIEKRQELLDAIIDAYYNSTILYGHIIRLKVRHESIVRALRILIPSLGKLSPIVTEFSDGDYIVDIIENGKRWFDSVEFSKIADGQCIKVDAEDELYLTDDFIVTHNTSLTTSLALYAAGYRSPQNDNKGFKVIQIVFEDRIKQIQRKHFSKITQIEACNLSKAEYSQHVKEILENYEDRELIQENLRIIRLKSGEKSIDFIIELIKKHVNNGFRPDLVIIDYFECIKLTGQSTMSKWDKETSIMRKIEASANELNVAFWVPVQGNKESINTELVTMDNGGGSIGKIQVAHIIMTITRSIEDIADNIATIAILKNRAGSSGKVINGVLFNNGTCTISTDNVEDFDSPIQFGKHKESAEDERNKELTKDIFLSTKKQT